MKTITIRDLHQKTGKWVRLSAEQGEIHISDRGHPIAKIVPCSAPRPTPYFRQRKLIPAFQQLVKTRTERGGSDGTQVISDDRNGR
ncbi:MAG: hypothetical protein PHV34_20185 [Verrucomicrobiae bacterium]|nr:hypothetical protein [Verrucomicrobiae bacterium]